MPSLTFFSSMFFGLLHVHPIDSTVMVELCLKLTRRLHHYRTSRCDHRVTSFLLRCLQHCKTIAVALLYSLLNISDVSKSHLWMVKKLILRLCLPCCSSQAPSVQSLWWMPTNLSWDDCDQRTEWRLPHIKEHHRIHLEIILLCVSLILDHSCLEWKAPMTWRSGVIKAEHTHWPS